MTSESVKVAVRVRPFNGREKDRGAKAIIQMVGSTTKIVHPNDPQNVKSFTFDYSYWSHDGYSEASDGQLEPTGPTSPYASQQRVFDDLGQDVLHNALQGYNCSLFAYGQTGSGKSYSMIGYEKNKGIVPITCNELFKIVESDTNSANKYAISFSMLEIYNENVHDLLKKSSGNLEVRQSDKLGFYVQNLEKVPVGSYKEIEKRINQGTANRTIAATQMNATSSRAHTVITVEFKQIISSDSGINTKSSAINLIDLAGSERADSTGATGDRLKEGANINKSLSALGNVIAALADLSGGKKNIIVPYRDSVLTKMLKNALGGNSKTIMIAALSPADINYDETLSTLRYADRTKRIKNTASINENPLEKLIRDLREENERLKRMLNGELLNEMNTESLSPEDVAKMRKEIEEELRVSMRNTSELLELNDVTSWQAKIKEAEDNDVSVDQSIVDRKREQYPYMSNLNEDAQLSGVLTHFIEEEEVVIGKSVDGDTGSVIRIGGPGVQNKHCITTFDPGNKTVTIQALSDNAVVRVNGIKITGAVLLNDLDRLLLGSCNMYIFHNPWLPSDAPVAWDWQAAQIEVASADGYNSEERSAFESQIVEIIPLISEVNAISLEMGRDRIFSILIIPQIAQDVLYGEEAKSKVMIKMTNTMNQNSWLWERSKFINRRYSIQQLYQSFISTDVNKDQAVSIDEDPFWDPIEDIIVGNSHSFLQPLTYNLGMDYSLSVVDYKGREEGVLSVYIGPCDEDGTTFDEDDDDDSMIIDDPNELIGKPFYMKVTVLKLCLYKHRFINGSTVKFRVYRDNETYSTLTLTNTLEPQFNHSTVIEFPVITKDHLEYFLNGSITFSVYAIQKDVRIVVPNQKILGPDNKRSPVNRFDLTRQAAELRVCKLLNKLHNDKNERLKQICINWASRPESEQQFNPFFKEVSSVAFISGKKKFKLVADIVTKSRAVTSKRRRQKNDGEAADGDGDDKDDNNGEEEEEQRGQRVPERAKITISRKKHSGKVKSELCSTM